MLRERWDLLKSVGLARESCYSMDHLDCDSPLEGGV